MTSENKYLSFITTKEIPMQSFFPYSEETARRYLRDKIFIPHSMDGSAQLTYLGSAKARYEALVKAKTEAKRERKGYTLEQFGKILNQVSMEHSGSNDGEGYVVWRLKKGDPFGVVGSDYTSLVLQEIR